MSDPDPSLMIPGQWEPRRPSGTILADTSRRSLEAPATVALAGPIGAKPTIAGPERPRPINVVLFVGVLLVVTLLAMFGASLAR